LRGIEKSLKRGNFTLMEEEGNFTFFLAEASFVGARM